MNIPPQSTLRLVRQLTDPSDSGTNYVQATARNSATGDTVATVNLTDGGSQRFTGSFSTPVDASGLGYYLDVTTKVYTDAGYTTLNTNYAIETNTYFVHEQPTHFGGGGADVSYDKIRKIVQEAVGGLEMPEMPAIPEQKDLTPAMSAMETRIVQAIADKVIPTPEKLNLTPVLSHVDAAVDTILQAVDQKDVTPETDLTPVQEDIANLPIQQMIDAISTLNERLSTLQDLVNTQQDVTAMLEAAEEFKQKVSPRTLNVPKEKPQDTMQLRARRLLGV